MAGEKISGAKKPVGIGGRLNARMMGFVHRPLYKAAAGLLELMSI